MVTFITPTQGNPIALKRTMESLKDICNEFIIGSVCLFQQDVEIIESYKSEFNLKVVKLPFNFIQQNGFSSTLNTLANEATNDIVLYLNVGEIVEPSGDIKSRFNKEYNAYYIDHETERHRWFRVYNRHEMKWSGLIHEEIVGDYRPYHKPLFRFADTEKDNIDPFKAKVYDTVKEITYFSLLCKLVDDNSLLGATSGGWLQFASDQYASMKERLLAKGKHYEAFNSGDYEAFMNDIMTSPFFEEQRFESSLLIEYQNGKRYL